MRFEYLISKTRGEEKGIAGPLRGESTVPPTPQSDSGSRPETSEAEAGEEGGLQSAKRTLSAVVIAEKVREPLERLGGCGAEGAWPPASTSKPTPDRPQHTDGCLHSDPTHTPLKAHPGLPEPTPHRLSGPHRPLGHSDVSGHTGLAQPSTTPPQSCTRSPNSPAPPAPSTP